MIDDTTATAATPTDATSATPDTSAAQAAPAATTETIAQPSLDEQLAQALDRGIAQADGSTNAQAPKPIPPEGESTPGEAAPAKAAQSDQTQVEDEQAKAQVETDIKGLQLGDKAADRFRSMSSELRDLRPLKEQLEKAGVKDFAQLPRMVQRAQVADEWEQQVASTRATPEQMGMSFDYLRLVNTGTPQALNKAYEMMTRELDALAKIIGVEAPNYDPLADHPDLKTRVDNLDLERKDALEIARSRQTGKLTAATQEASSRAAARNDAITSARDQINALETRLRTADGDYERKRPFLLPLVKRICANMAPERWLAEVEAAYKELPAVPAAQPPISRIPAQAAPVASSAVMIKQTNDPMEAMDQAIAAVNARSA